MINIGKLKILQFQNCLLKNNIKTLKEITEAKEIGLLHDLYKKYQLKYGDSELNSNIAVPYLENNCCNEDNTNTIQSENLTNYE